MWKTVAPTIVTGAIRPISVTGTISTAIPASTQSIRFWHESSLYRKLPVAVIVKIDIGRAMRSSRPARNSAIISTIRGDAVLGEGAATDGLASSSSGPGRAATRRETWASMSSFVENAVARYGDVLEAVAEADVLGEVGRVGEARLAGPVVEDLQAARAGHEVDAVAAELRVGLAVAVVERERAGRGRDRRLDDVRAGRGRGSRRGRAAGRARGGAASSRGRGSPSRPRRGRASPRRRSGRSARRRGSSGRAASTPYALHATQRTPARRARRRDSSP